MNLLGASILFVLLCVVLGASRRMALLGMMAGVLFLTQAQQINVAGFNLFAIRFLELAGFIRVIARREFSFRELNGIDRALLLLYAYTTTVFLLRSTEGAANQIGEAVDAFLCYFTFRGLLHEVEELRWFLCAFIVLLLPYALLVMMASVAHHNLFAYLGGVQGGADFIRHGRPRCFGSFRQPDTLGMFAASFLPLYIGLVLCSADRKKAIFAICACLAIIFAANSGGPIGGAAAGLVSWGFWRCRTKMRLVRWGIVAIIASLALVMKAPIWYIFTHFGSFTGGDAWHRSYLMDVTWQHLSQWWLAGIPISKTAGWFAYDLTTTGGADITNQYIGFGLTAGLGAIILFIVLLKRAYSAIGRALSVVRSNASQFAYVQFLLWGCGATLTVHVADWFGISYFDQMYVVWFMQLAVIASTTEVILKQPVVEMAKPTQFDVLDSQGNQASTADFPGSKVIS